MVLFLFSEVRLKSGTKWSGKASSPYLLSYVFDTVPKLELFLP